MAKECVVFDAAQCYPCKKLPDCYAPPKLSPEAQALACAVALAWRDGYYVVVVEGEEFIL
jgi:hypothetical protein